MVTLGKKRNPLFEIFATSLFKNLTFGPPVDSRGFQHSSALRGDDLMRGGEKGVVVKRFIEISDRPGLYRRVPHRVVVVRGTYDHAGLGRNGLELLLDFEAAHFCHPDINHGESHRMT